MSSTSGPGNLEHPGPEEAGMVETRRAQAAARRRIWAGVVVMIAGALLPVLGSLLDGGGATVLWLASMPVCLAGAALVAAGVLRRHSLRPRLHEDWG